MKKQILLVALSATTFISSCQKGEKGDTGPAGTNGTNGNANVIGTNTVTVAWQLSSGIYVAGITAQGITQEIVDKGLVMVFIKYGNQWVPLPDISGKNSTVYAYEVGRIDLINSNSDGSIPAYPSNSTFRVVIIPANAKMTNPNGKWTDYNFVRQFTSEKTPIIASGE